MKNILLAFKKVIILFAVLVLIFSVLLLVLVSFSPIKTFQVFRVMSGSMEPAVKTGSVVFVKQINLKELKTNDIITFSANNSSLPITHRIIQMSQNGKIITKGDANKTNDIDPVNTANIRGKVLYVIPYFGYISVWTKTPLGFIFFIILPALLIIINEIFSIRRVVRDEIKKKINETKMPIILALILVSGVISLMLIKPTSAFFSNGLVLSGNIFSTGNWVDPVLTLTESTDKKSLTFKMTNISAYKNLSYKLTYDTDTVSEGVMGSDTISGQMYTSLPISLGSCSSNGKCTYNTGVHNVVLKVTLSRSGGSKVLTGSL
jgi:signal peptidase I